MDTGKRLWTLRFLCIIFLLYLYRCINWPDGSTRCRATAVVDKTTDTVKKVTRPHNHEPHFLRKFVRYVCNFLTFRNYSPYVFEYTVTLQK